MFTQILDPTGNLFLTWLVALIPVVLLLFLLAGLRMSAWLAVLIGSIVTFLLGLWVWKMPFGDGVLAYVYGSATGIWNVDWITFWGVMLFNTLVTTGSFDKLRRWLVQQGTRDVRVQTILFAWAFGALLEGLVGFGYPWAFVAPILIAIGIPDLHAIRVAAIANNAPVSDGALGAPIIALATVTAGTLGMSFVEFVADLFGLGRQDVLFVSGSKGMWSAWPLASVGSLGYIAGQLPTAVACAQIRSARFSPRPGLLPVLPQHRGVARTLIAGAMRDVCMGPPRGGPIVLVLGRCGIAISPVSKST